MAFRVYEIIKFCRIQGLIVIYFSKLNDLEKMFEFWS